MVDFELVWECCCGHENTCDVVIGKQIKNRFDDKCASCGLSRHDRDLTIREKDSQEETIRAIVFEILTENRWKFTQE